MARRRGSLNRLLLASLVVIPAALTGCGESEPVATPRSLGPPVGVALYGRNALAVDVWLAVNVVATPPLSVGFHRFDRGVVCWSAPANAEIVLLDRDPARGGSVVKIVAIVGPDPGQRLWVDIAADGSSTSGTGVPAWWGVPGLSGDC